MNHEFDYDVSVIGAGRIGLPWAACLAKAGHSVQCIDIDPDVVARINDADPWFSEPRLDEYLKTATATGRLVATTDMDAVGDSKIVATTLNAPNEKVGEYLNIVSNYAEWMDRSQVIVNRTTLPVQAVDDAIETIASHVEAEPDALQYVSFPERLAQGRAIEEIETLPKILGYQTEVAKEAMEWILTDLDGDLKFTDPKSAMFIKLMDNAYRDAKFAIANQFAILANEIGIDPHSVIEMANDEYPRNDIPSPGTVGGKCLTKDPYFLSRQYFDVIGTTPDLFSTTRSVNNAFERHVAETVLDHNPDSVALLGTTYKRDAEDEACSPALSIKDMIEDAGVSVSCFDPHVDARGDSLSETISGTDLTVIAVNHTYFAKNAIKISHLSCGRILDIWNEITSGLKLEGTVESVPNCE